MKPTSLFLIVCLDSLCRFVPVVAADDTAFFETRIRPVLVRHCYECHSAASAKLKGELRVDFRDGLRKGGESGPAVVPGEPGKGQLIAALRHESFEMPPAGKLSDRVIADFERWIRDGAVDPRDRPPTVVDASESTWQAVLKERSGWWSLQPLRDVSPPTVDNALWSREPVDRFIRTALAEEELSPAKPAEADVLLRRISFVLTGLPPRPEQVASFPKRFDANPEAALSELVDDLLQSPHFGERFARHWMDVVRYTDTYGYEWDNPAKGSWEYRDYLIRAFNDDVGFDQLIREQIAGDLLDEPRINKTAGVNESLVGPMFYHMGEHRHGNSLNFNGIHQEMINNKIDAFSKTFLGMTVACARCHDHKLDAVSQADYYALAGVFMSPRWTTRVIDAPGKHDAQIAELSRLRREIRDRLAERWLESNNELEARLRTWTTTIGDILKKVPLEDVAYPLRIVTTATEETIAGNWGKASSEWTSTRQARLKSNSDRFSVLSDFSSPEFPAGWTTEGDGIAHGYVEHGTPLISLGGEAVTGELLVRGYHTHALSSKLPGAVRLPAQRQLAGKFVSLKLRGQEWSGYLVAPQNAFQAESVTFLDPKSPASRWMTIGDVGHTNGVTRVLTDLATSALNPNFPPRTGLARAGQVRLPEKDEGFGKRSWFSLTGIVTHDAGGTPASALDEYASLYEAERPSTVDDAWYQTAKWFKDAVQRWAANEATAGDVRLINWLLGQKLLSNTTADAELAALVREYRDVEAKIAFPRTANSMDERAVEPVNYRLNVRGNVNDEGPAIPRSFLRVFAGKQNVGKSSGSGRFELARYLSSGKNPQPARVYVNRVWSWVFGAGIVNTPNDFGKLGGRPSHPDLLDWLANRFMQDGWSTKTLVKKLILSQTFRQSGSVDPRASSADPQNRLLHHYHTRRLEAEAIRDSLLAVSGRLDPRLFGPPINPYRRAEDPAKRLFSGPLDGDGRRAIYQKMSIMSPPEFLVLFNLPDLKLPTGRRDVTNVPAQALLMLNHPFVVDMAKHWGESVTADGLSNPEDRVRAMFTQALGREPDTDESARWVQAVTRFAKSDEVMADKEAWADLAHAFFNVKEFIYYR